MQDGDTPLLRAVRSRNLDMVRILLDKGAKVSATDKVCTWLLVVYVQPSIIKRSCTHVCSFERGGTFLHKCLFMVGRSHNPV